MNAKSRAIYEYKKASEHDEQVRVFNWIFDNIINYPELDLAYAVPNGAMLGGGRIGAIRANALKAEGLRPGVSDIVVPSPRGGYFGMYLEMKTKTGTLSENQKEFLFQVKKYGYFGAVAYGADEAIEILEGYLKKPYTKAAV